ncbi:MAG: hypothetical protein ACQPRJ_00680 [Solitalea-like symbiont of Acarus siro]
MRSLRKTTEKLPCKEEEYSLLQMPYYKPAATIRAPKACIKLLHECWEPFNLSEVPEIASLLKIHLNQLTKDHQDNYH